MREKPWNFLVSKKAITKLQAIAIVVIVIAALIGGVAYYITLPAPSEEIKLTFWSIWANEFCKKDALVTAIRDFEKENPHITIEDTWYESAAYKDVIRTSLAAGAGPDIMYSWPSGWMWELVKEGHYADLTDLLDASHFDPEKYNMHIIRGPEGSGLEDRVFLAPIDFHNIVFFYNKEIFNECGVEPPETFEEFKNVITTVKNCGYIPIALGNLDQWLGTFFIDVFAQPYIGIDNVKKLVKHEISWTDPDVVQGVSYVQEIVELGAFPEGCSGIGRAEGRMMFVNEQAAILHVTGDWVIGMLEEEAPEGWVQEKVGAFKVPTISGRPYSGWQYAGIGGCFAINANSEHKEEAAAFLNFFTTPEYGKMWVKAVKHASCIAGSVTQETPPEILMVEETQVGVPGYFISFDEWLVGDLLNEYWARGQQLIDGVITAEEYCEYMEAVASAAD